MASDTNNDAITGNEVAVTGEAEAAADAAVIGDEDVVTAAEAELMNDTSNAVEGIMCCSRSKPSTPKRLDTMSLTAGGDWMCSACQHLNFKKRETCQLCGYPKYGGPDPATYICNATKVLAGDWYCPAINCQAHNYASRSSCYSCGTLKSGHAAGGYASDGSDPPGWKTGDWICNRSGCGVHNYASRMECYRCRTPREYGGGY
uniref:Transcription initiation factor TFIID subunit 15-like n=2 Tax=Populus TaxID=3689 RepID=A0A4U5Q9B8_POPAL|nr:transcription initiation factor TFIID subunit 15-like [Populus alba]